MTLKVQMKVTGNASKQLKQFVKKLDKAKRKTLKDFGDQQKREARQRIAVSKTDPNNRRWAPWAVATLRARTRRGSASRGLLYESGHLWRSVGYKLKRNQVEIGSTADYAKYLQRGRRGGNSMRPRQIFNLNTPRAKKQFIKLFKKNMRR